MGSQPVYGPHNPHPLSQMRTELVWEGKYDEYGNRREVDVAGLSMPLQKIETIDQPRAEAEEAGQLQMFEKKSPRNKKGDHAGRATRKQPSGRISISIISNKHPPVKQFFLDDKSRETMRINSNA